MALIQFIVLKRKGKWAVMSVDQEQFFSIQEDGKPSVVLLQKAKNKFDTIWTYGESAFPPSKSDVLALSEAS